MFRYQTRALYMHLIMTVALFTQTTASHFSAAKVRQKAQTKKKKELINYNYLRINMY